jgi:hypothetical protein
MRGSFGRPAMQPDIRAQMTTRAGPARSDRERVRRVCGEALDRSKRAALRARASRVSAPRSAPRQTPGLALVIAISAAPGGGSVLELDREPEVIASIRFEPSASVADDASALNVGGSLTTTSVAPSRWQTRRGDSCKYSPRPAPSPPGARRSRCETLHTIAFYERSPGCTNLRALSGLYCPRGPMRRGTIVRTPDFVPLSDDCHPIDN